MIDIFSRRKDYYGLPGGMVVKNPPANAGNARDKSSVLGSGRSPEIGNGNQSNILAWKIPWLGEPSGLQFMGHKESDTIEQLSTHKGSFMKI